MHACRARSVALAAVTVRDPCWPCPVLVKGTKDPRGPDTQEGQAQDCQLRAGSGGRGAGTGPAASLCGRPSRSGGDPFVKGAAGGRPGVRQDLWMGAAPTQR